MHPCKLFKSAVLYGVKRCLCLTVLAAKPQQAHTAKMLKTALPTIVPTPISPSVINVPITFVNSSGADVAMAMKDAPATSLGIFAPENKQPF